MVLQPFREEQLNYFRFAFLVVNEFPKTLRHIFKSMWDNTFGHLHGYQLWDDSTAVRNLFLGKEGSKTRIPTNLSYEEWDCTAMFQATIYARCFSLPDSTGHQRTLSQLFVNSRKVPRGNFHVSVVSPGGNNAETFAIAIDQLRLLRNSLCHLPRSEMDKATFDKWVQHAKDAFKALGVNTDAIDTVGGMTESDFPTEKVRALEEDIREVLQRENQLLQEEVKDKLMEIQESLERVEKERKEELEAGAKVSLPRSCLPPKVPHFAGRQRECEEIISHINSESTRIVSIWGSPGFGKTSVAVAVGHRLQTQGLPVWFLSLRGLQSKADLTSKLLSHLRQPSASDQSFHRLSLDDELCNLVTAIPDSFLLILDNADELLESGVPNVKEEVIHLLEEILRRNERVKIAVTTRESLEFLNVHFQGHHAVRIRPLDTSSSQKLVHDLLPSASTSDCQNIAQICGNVPLALQLMCPFISEGDAKPISQSLEDFMVSTRTIIEKLDNPNYPSNLKLQLLFESSFQRLSTQEKESLVSLCILRENFDQKVAAVVLGQEDQEDVETKKMLQSLQRKSLLDSGPKPGSFSMHSLIQSFTREKGEHEMKKTFLKSKARFHEFYVSLFEKLNNDFLAGCSMSAFIGFYEDKQSIIQCLIESCSDSRTADDVFEVLSKAEMFLDSLFWLSSEAANFDKIFDSALKGAKTLKSNVLYRRLLVSRAFSEITWGTRGKTMHLLSEAGELQETSSSATDGEKGKRLCYIGLYQLVTGQTQNGVKSLREALSLVDNSAEGTVLKIIVCQILAVYYQFKNYSIDPTCVNRQIVQVCRTVEDTYAHLLVLPAMESIRKETRKETRKVSHADNASTSRDQPLQLQVIFFVNEVAKHFIHVDTNKSLVSSLYKILKGVETELAKDVSLGLFSFHRIVVVMFQYFTKSKDAQIELAKERINYHQVALEQCTNNNERNEDDIAITTDMHKDALAKSFLDLGSAQRATGDLLSALQSEKCALDIRLEQFGEEHSSTADSYHSLGASYYSAGDFASALQSTQRALNIRRRLYGEEHPTTAYSYQFVAATQHKLGDFSSALQSKQRALNIRLKLFGEEHSSVADSYYSLYVTQLAAGDKTAAVQSKQRALDIKHKLCGEHSVTAERYSSVAVQRQELGEYTSDRTEWLDINDYS